jgi:pyruvate,orthophosphate dikinase
VQDGHLYLLQTRNGKGSAQALARIALDLCDAGVISAEVARQRTAGLAEHELVTTRTTSADGQSLVPLAHAASASSGVAMGEIAFDEASARTRHAAGASVLLVRRDAETADIAALELAVGLLTQRGARTSHAAVVARQLGKVCLVGCSELRLDETAKTLQLGETIFREGDVLTLDGNDGAVYAGAVHTVTEPMVELCARLERLRLRSEPPAAPARHRRARRAAQ